MSKASNHEKDKPLEERAPGFNELPDVDPSRPAATDMIDEAVNKGMEKLAEDFSGEHTQHEPEEE
ncbi:hypothetical protein [Paenibacillus massiliensis]|uniref:hypothetical protein n=1 Tax=Paenibacillus massiliensis TaxID=225917 RepID=UPI000415D5DA|nr:hypothetical protein [Paenibacillus massiliensis]